jgi:tetratricopeptide (TPR) repeat protein
MSLSVALLRPQLSGALVMRGDDLLYQSRDGRALQFYRRALFVDPENAAAADRYVFVSLMGHGRSSLERAVVVASIFLARHVDDVTLLMDRALCERVLSRNQAAESDFLRAGLISHDARALVFAGYAALRAGGRSRARRWWRLALAMRSGYIPAERALRLR